MGSRKVMKFVRSIESTWSKTIWKGNTVWLSLVLKQKYVLWDALWIRI